VDKYGRAGHPVDGNMAHAHSTHTHTHTHIHTHIHTYVHTYIHTYTESAILNAFPLNSGYMNERQCYVIRNIACFVYVADVFLWVSIDV
jgi:hypothetical protein